MPRFFIKEENIMPDGKIRLFGDDANHVSHSLRMRVGDKITVCDFFNYEYDCIIEAFTSDDVTLSVVEKHTGANEPSVSVSLFQGVPKSTKLEMIIQKCVELGISKIYPVAMARCISRPDEKSSEKKTKRWNMISQEAAKQSGRGVVPEVCDTVSFRDAIKKLKEHDVCFLCYEMCDETQDADIKTFLKRSVSETTGSVAFLVGPEGGISPEEAAYAKENGISFVSLGKRILRTETAPLCVLSCIMYESDNMK